MSCPRCGGDPGEVVEIRALGEADPIRSVRSCCTEPPSPAVLAVQADEEWLARHRRLAQPDGAGDAP